jgi:AhpD family alkylhydroperoxidase
MARISLSNIADLSETDRALYDQFPTNLIRGILRTNGCTVGYMTLGFDLLRNAKLDPRQFELVILRVAALTNCGYERMQHLPPARQAGWTDADIAAIERGEGSKLDPTSAALLAFVDECVNNVRVSDPTFAELRERISESAIADVTLLVGFYVMTAMYLEVLEVDLDDNSCQVLADRKTIRPIAS